MLPGKISPSIQLLLTVLVSSVVNRHNFWIILIAHEIGCHTPWFSEFTQLLFHDHMLTNINEVCKYLQSGSHYWCPFFLIPNKLFCVMFHKKIGERKYSSIVTFSQKTFNSRLFSEAPYSLRAHMTSTRGSQLMDHRPRGSYSSTLRSHVSCSKSCSSCQQFIFSPVTVTITGMNKMWIQWLWDMMGCYHSVFCHVMETKGTTFSLWICFGLRRRPHTQRGLKPLIYTIVSFNEDTNYKNWHALFLF